METKIKVTNLILIGFGAVHQNFVRILTVKRGLLAERYHLELRVVGVADSGGATYQPAGFNLKALLEHKLSGSSIYAFPGGRPLPDALSLAQASDYGLLLEASPVNLSDGEPAMACIRAALSRGRSAVLANKAPLVLDYSGLHDIAQANDARLTFSATVCGGLPVLNVGQRDLLGATLYKVEGIFNSTTNYMLARMAAGETYTAALAEAQRRGVAETNPALDVEGWDTANKLVIIANAVLGYAAKLKDVEVEGITKLRQRQLAEVQDAGDVYKLIATAEREGQHYRLSVKPRQMSANSFLGRISHWQMGIHFHTDIYEHVYLKIDEREPTATAAAMLRDAVHLAASSIRF